MECKVHKLVADVAAVSGGRVLLVKYRDTRKYDGQEGWFLPDDYLEHLEHPDDAAKRIAREQTGLSIEAPRLAHIESFGNGAWHLVFHYTVELDAALSPSPAENVVAAEWFQLEALPPRSEVAHDGWAIDVLERVVGKTS